MKINGVEVKESAIVKPKPVKKLTKEQAKALSKTYNGMANQKKSK